MTGNSLRPVWETLPIERQRGLLLTLGQMAMRQVRSPPVVRQTPIGETADDGPWQGFGLMPGSA